MLVRRNRWLAKRLNKFDRWLQSNDISDVWRAGFEFVWKIVIGSFLKRNLFDHFSASKKRRHLFKKFFLAV